jgi:fucose 4-O-acetylase-like acetyltransferase
MSPAVLETQGRLIWLDVYKGLAIALVVLGHMQIPGVAAVLIYSFHVPLFFIAAGYGMALSRKRSMGAFLAGRWRTLVVPYGLFSLIGLAWVLLLRSPTSDPIHVLQRSLLGILLGNGSASPKTVLTPLWFLTCLVSTEVLFLLLQHLSKGRWQRLVPLLLGFLVLGLVNSTTWRLTLPWGGHLAPVALGFYGAGYLYCRHHPAQTTINLPRALIGLSLALPLWLTLALTNGRVDMNANNYGQPLLFLTSAFSGSIMIYFIAQIMERQTGFARVATYLGANSLVILATHTLWPGISRQLFATLAAIAPAPLTPLFTSRLDMLLSVGMVWISIELINRHLPGWIGRRRAS